MKKLIALISSLFLFTGITYAQGQATARIFETQSAKLSRIVVVYENGESEVIDLKNWKLFGSTSSLNETLIDNQKAINKFLQTMTDKGYKLTKMTSTGESFIYTFMVFEKEE